MSEIQSFDMKNEVVILLTVNMNEVYPKSSHEKTHIIRYVDGTGED